MAPSSSRARMGEGEKGPRMRCASVTGAIWINYATKSTSRVEALDIRRVDYRPDSPDD